jgi:hypothetical protein
MHIFDVLPNSFPTAPGIEEAKAVRKVLVEQMVKKPPKIFSARGCKETQAKLRQRAAEQGGVAAVLQQRVADAAADYAGEESEDDVPLALVSRRSPAWAARCACVVAAAGSVAALVAGCDGHCICCSLLPPVRCCPGVVRPAGAAAGAAICPCMAGTLRQQCAARTAAPA